MPNKGCPDDLRNKIWSLVEGSIDGYSALIDRLMSHMTDKQLKEVLDVMDDQEEDDDD